MEHLIEDLLTLSRIEGQAINQVARTEGVAATIEDDLRPRVNEVGGKLVVAMSPAQIGCSESLLRQVLWNLGENSVKYRRPDVPLVLEIFGRATSETYELRVTDNGSGMSPDEARSAFEPFFRGQQTTSIPGTGLGLAIVRRIIEAHRGRISLSSIAGRGTTIRIRLPRTG
jgi:signal transduction histidine kinase